MKVIIAEIPKEGLEVDFKDELVSDTILSPVNASLRIDKVGTEVLVRGGLNTEVHLQCSRCLEDFRRTLSIPVEVVYHPSEELERDDNYEITNEELNTDFYTGEELDLFNILKEQIELNLPMKPLCNDLCKGLCPLCGTNLNSGNCKCSVRDTDPRFAALKQFIKERKEE
jgi:uncharacterized protein